MKSHNLTQGSPAWHTHRANHYNASDAAAMLSISPHTARAALLHSIATGIDPDVDAGTQARFDAGHAAEAAARPVMESMFDLDLYPVVGSRMVDDLPLSASFDGLTMDEAIVWEHKSFNVELAQSMDMGVIPAPYCPQLEQQLLVSGAETVLFSCSSVNGGTPRFAWYKSDAKLRARLLAGWTQFAADLAEYRAPAPAVIAPAGSAPESLPALHIAIDGRVTASNVADFKTRALVVLGGINRTLCTDQDFADAEKTVKWCADVEARLAAAKQHALSQTADIDALYRTIDDISASTRAVRLELDKLIKARKDEIKTAIVLAAKVSLAEHIAALDATLPPAVRLPAPIVDFAACIKGKRDLDAMRAAVDAALMSARFDASQLALRYNVNVALVLVANHDFLFADMGQLAAKDPDDVRAIIAQRVGAHANAMAAKVAADTARAMAAQFVADAAAQAAADAQAAAQAAADAQAAAAPAVPAPAVPAPAVPAPQMPEIVPGSLSDMFVNPARPPASLRLGVVCDRLGVNMTADFLARLGFAPAVTIKGGKFYHADDFPGMCAALCAHITAAAAKVWKD